MIAFYAERATFLSFAEMDVDCVGEVTNVEEDEVFFMDDLQLKYSVDYWTSSKEGAPLATQRNTELISNHVVLFIIIFVVREYSEDPVLVNKRSIYLKFHHVVKFIGCGSRVDEGFGVGVFKAFAAFCHSDHVPYPLPLPTGNYMASKQG